MSHDRIITRARLKTPKAAAVAGIVFAVLLAAIFWLLRSAIPADPLETGAWLAAGSGQVALALNLVPIAGISFLWFIGVLRDRLGARADRFFATVFLGSGLLFLGDAVHGRCHHRRDPPCVRRRPSRDGEFGDAPLRPRPRLQPHEHLRGEDRRRVHDLDLDRAIYTGMAPRWIAVLGYALALILLFGSYYLTWSFAVMPLWVLLVSILIDNFRASGAAVAAGAGE